MAKEMIEYEKNYLTVEVLVLLSSQPNLDATLNPGSIYKRNNQTPGFTRIKGIVNIIWS